MSRYYCAMSASALRDELDRLEERLSELEEEGAQAVGLRNQIFYVCDALCRKENAA